MVNTYLAVSFAQKDEAQASDALWDGVQKQWYVPADRKRPGNTS